MPSREVVDECIRRLIALGAPKVSLVEVACNLPELMRGLGSTGAASVMD